MKEVIHKIDERTRRIFFIHSPKENLLEKASHHFTKEQKLNAKLRHDVAKKDRAVYDSGRNEIIMALATTKNEPRFELKIMLL